MYRKEEEQICQIYPELYDAFCTFDPGTQGHCSVRVLLWANCVCDDGWRDPVYWKNPKISLILALCRNTSELAAPNIKTGSSKVHCISHASSQPSRRCVIINEQWFIYNLHPSCLLRGHSDPRRAQDKLLTERKLTTEKSK